jgi:ubiquitin C-terminal hydrolase
MDYIPIEQANINFVGNGVKNCGVSCFFNSTNQMLFHMVEFREFMILYKNIFSSNQILYALAGLFEKMKRGNVILTSDEIVPGVKLENLYHLVDDRISGGSRQQQDASEVIELVYWLELDNFFRPILNVSPTFGSIQFGYKIEFLNLLKIDLPFLNIYNKLKVTNICIDNNFTSETIETTSTLKIMTNNNRFTINLDQPTTEILELDNQINNCKRIPNRRNTRQNNHYYFNKYLIVNLKRFRNISGNSIKVEDRVYMNGSELNLNGIKIINNYEFIGAVCQSGSLGGGHYWYIHKVNNIWYEYNDDNIYPNISKTNHPGSYRDSSHMYMLLFRRTTDNPYRIPVYNLDRLNNVILTNMRTFRYDVINEKSQFVISNYFNILTYYSNLYNRNTESRYNQQILLIINYLRDKLRTLF